MFLAATVSGAGSLSGPAVPVLVVAPSACSSVSVPAPGGDSPAGAALGSSPALSGAAGACLAERGPIRVRSVAGVGLLPLPALLVWLAHPPPLCPLLRLRMYRRV